MREHPRAVSVWRVRILVTALVATGCTKPNPASCADGTCTEPALPFCDVDGALAGEPRTCIAVACTPGEFAVCRGDREITCNAQGTDYDLTQCERGCDALSDGCRVCSPGQTVCANGKVQTCDANGNVVASEACPLGCFEDQPRCRDIDPSNNLGMYLDMTPDPQDLDLSMGATINTSTGTITDRSAHVISASTFLVPAGSGGTPIRVIVARHVSLGDVGTVEDQIPGPALAIVATGDIDVQGTVRVLAGSVVLPSCVGARGLYGDGPLVSSTYQYFTESSGGGANATPGGRGGWVVGTGNESLGAGGGTPVGTKALVPLQGGCAGGGAIDDVNGNSSFGPTGGGALQLSSRTIVRVAGSINAAGQPSSGAYAAGGGGAGGGIVLEAPRVLLGPQASLLAGGADGNGCTPAITNCGSGGIGATNDHAAGSGGNATYGTPTPTTFFAGGGGGGLGRLRINTPTRTYEKSNTTVEIGDLSTGTLSTR